MCGICGMLYTHSCEHVIENRLSTGLRSLRHRGYDGCGISINLPYLSNLTRRRIVSTQQFIQQFECGFTPPTDLNDTCNTCNKYRVSGIAHTRYRTAGDCMLKNTQPVFNREKTISLVHNGQVEVYRPTDGGVEDSLSTEHLFDSKYILEVFCKTFKQTDSIFRSVKAVHDTVKGSYACVIMILKFWLV